MFRKNLAFALLLLVAMRLLPAQSAERISFADGVPSDWQSDGVNWYTGTYYGDPGIWPDIYGARIGTEGTLTSSSIGKPQSDNVIVSAEFSNNSPSIPSRVDRFQIIASTNAWNSFIELSDPFVYNDPTVNSRWVTHSFTNYISGLMSCDDFRVGIKVVAVGNGNTYIYLRSISVDFPSCATPRMLRFETGSESEQGPRIGDKHSIVSVVVEKEPAKSISNLTVKAVVSRNNLVYTNQMFAVGESNVYTNNIIDIGHEGGTGKVIDAGDHFSVVVMTEYETDQSTLGTLDEETGFYSEKSAPLEYTVPQGGSVWVNEFSLRKVELAGTTNRVPLMAGWSLELRDMSSNVVQIAEFNEPFNLTNRYDMVNGVVGFDTRELDWNLITTNNPYMLRLINSGGVVEHLITNIEFKAAYSSYGMVGVAPWHADYSYDWSGTADGTFTLASFTTNTFGSVNEGQFFEVYGKGWVQAHAVDISSNNVEYATINCIVKFSGGETNIIMQTGNGGLTPLKLFEGSHYDTNVVPAYFEAKAFGWQADRVATEFIFQEENTNNTIVLHPTIASDNFSGELLKPYWENSNFILWSGLSDGIVYFDTYGAQRNSRAELTSLNYLSSRQKGVATIAFSVYNSSETVLRPDYAYVQLATNKAFRAGDVVLQTPSAYNKNEGRSAYTWCTNRFSISLSSELSDVSGYFVRLCGVAGGNSYAYLNIDDLCIAFQDMVTITNLVQSGTETEPGFVIDVEPWCGNGQSVSNVTVQLVMDVNDGEFLFTNCVAEVDALSTNSLTRFTVSNDVVNAWMLSAIRRPLRAHDKVKYWAQVKYFADSRDLDPAKEWETRYFPDNAIVDSEGRWTVEGEYGVDSASVASNYWFKIPGDPITMNGDFVLTNADVTTVSFGCRAYSAVGVSNVTVMVSTNGVDFQTYQSFVTNGVVRFDNEVTLTNLVANMGYTVKITAKDVNGHDLKDVNGHDFEFAEFTFKAMPKVTKAWIEGVSQTAARLTVEGSAEGFVVNDWAPEDGSVNTWIWSGLSPNVEVTATGIYGMNMNKGVEQRSVPIDATPGYTLAAVATKAPVIEKGVTTVAVKAGDDYALVDDGNSEGTEYAIRVTTSAGGDAIVSTNEVGDAIFSTNNDIAVWKTLDAWKSDEPMVVEIPQINLTTTNYFSFVTRNFDRVVSTNTNPIATNCWFKMEAGFNGTPAQQQAASRSDANFGKVAYSLVLSDPAQSASATATVQYKIGSGEWTTLESFSFEFDEIEKDFASRTWNAWAAVGETDGTYAYQLRAKVAAAGRESEWSEPISGTLDFAPPADLRIDGAPANGVVTSATGFDFVFDATDTNDVSFVWTLTGETGTTDGTGGTASRSNLQDGSYTLTVTATDAMGNTSAAATRTWKVDTIPPTEPTISGEPGDNAVTKETSFDFTASATDATTLTYHWSLNGGPETVGTNYTGRVDEDGTYTARVYAVDAAGNVSPTNSVRWTVDREDPTGLAISGAPAAGVITKDDSFDFTASATDATALTYHWSLNGGAETVGTNYTGTVAEDGTNTVSVYAVDAAGNRCAPVTRMWIFDKTPPTPPAISGEPSVGTVTASTNFSFTAEATDMTALTYHWKLNDGGEETVADSFAGVAVEGTNTVSVYAVDAAGNVSLTNSVSWTVDTTRPTLPVITGTPADGAVTREKDVNLSATSEDATELTYHWIFGEQTATGKDFKSTAVEGTNTVSVYAVDEAGNVSPTNSVSWTVDETLPTAPVISGEPGEGAVTASTNFSFTAEATDVTALTYRWKLNDGGEETVGDNFAGVAVEGTNTVSVYAVDGAGNVGPAATRKWVVDTTKPPLPVITGEPGDNAVTKETSFDFTASATDATTLTYHWKLNDSDEETVADSFAGVAVEGTNTVSVYAVDAAGNVSPTNSQSWTVDTERPTLPVITGAPEGGAVTTAMTFGFRASATDATALTYHWSLNDGPETVGADYAGTVAEDGSYTGRVYAVDAAGNVSLTNSVSWTVDTTRPTLPVITGEPGDNAVTKETSFDFTANATDATALTYHWSLNGGPETVGTNYTGRVAEDGTYTGRVYAVDAAGNVSPTNSVRWTVDREDPTGLAIIGAPADGAITKDDSFDFTASATDATALTYHWSLNGGAETVGTNYTGTVAEDGTNTVSVYAVDAAGNRCAPVARMWIFDKTPPTPPAISGEPSVGTVTASTNFSFTAEATDMTALTYHWKLNDGGEETVADSYDGVAVEGTNTVSVYAVDAAGNVSLTNSVSWTVDTTRPTLPVITGTPADGAVTREKDVDLSAASEDATELTYHWIFGEQTATGKDFKSTAVEGVNTVSVYAVDEAGNVSPTNSVSWTVDETLPTAPVISGEPGEGAVTASTNFSFTAEATDVTALTYHWKLNDSDEETVADSFAGVAVEGTNTVSVYAVDGAGNVGPSATRKWVVDTTRPAVELTSSTPNPFNADAIPLVVTAAFTEAVTNFTAASVTVSNGTVTAVAEVQDAENTFTVTISPESSGDVVVLIEEGVVADLAGNGNEASEPLTLVYDNEAPAVTLESITPNPFSENVTPLEVRVTFTEPVTNFTADAVAVSNGTVRSVSASSDAENTYTVTIDPDAPGNVAVQVLADQVADLAGNRNEASEVLTLEYDDEKPTVTLTSEPPNPPNGETNLTVTVTFSEPVTNFTESSVTVSNGTVRSVSASSDAENTYTVTIDPNAPGEDSVFVWVAEGAVTDMAGNENTASEVIERLTAKITTSAANVLNKSFDVTITFSKPVTNFTASSVVVSNGTVASVSGSGSTYSANISLASSTDGVVSVQIKGGLVDSEGNWSVASVPLTRICDKTPPSILITGTPAYGTTTNDKRFSLTAQANDEHGISMYYWEHSLNNNEEPIDTKQGNPYSGEAQQGLNKVTVVVFDAVWNSATATYSWIYDPNATVNRDVEFGGGICVKVDSETGETNEVRFTAVDFKPGEVSTFTLSGFDVSSLQEASPLGMWFVVSDTPGGAKRHEPVSATLDPNTTNLTVTLPAAATQSKGSLFIFGVDNKAQ